MEYRKISVVCQIKFSNRILWLEFTDQDLKILINGDANSNVAKGDMILHVSFKELGPQRLSILLMLFLNRGGT
jgi:hypothetical protein